MGVYMESGDIQIHFIQQNLLLTIWFLTYINNYNFFHYSPYLLVSEALLLNQGGKLFSFTTVKLTVGYGYDGPQRPKKIQFFKQYGILYCWQKEVAK